MHLGLQLPSFTWPEGSAALATTLRRIATTADEGGFASVWVMDHFFQIPLVGPAENDMLEGYTTLAFLAAATRRARLGTLVTGVTYRNPGVLVKTVSTLDVLSGGRAMLGIGAAWFEREHQGLGVPFPPLRERFERLEDALRIAKQMWSGEVAAFEGTHHRMAETLCIPQPLQRPHPPILIGGMGEKRTLRLVARYADACNLFAFAGAAEVGRKLEVLRRHCDREKRDFDAIERTTLGTAHLAPGKQSPADVIRELRELAKVGVQHAIVNLPNVHEITPLETLAKEVIPAVSEL
ncbi:MAG: LLM class F420-dependent oxidoreductase [Myxococcales bacterium]|jgi:F420-dependent oxidoreductase-like protein|nr:MAG: LLM class F420-dependent oxidoreductase [Myxococcales bacterium]